MGGGDTLIPEQIKFELPLLRAPVEEAKALGRRTTKYIEKELNDIRKACDNAACLANSDSKEETRAILSSAISQMKELKKSMKKFQEEDKVCLTRVQLRLQHLSSVMKNLGDIKSDDLHEPRKKLGHQETDNFKLLGRFERKRTDRMVCGHLLREGYLKSAKLLADESNIGNLIDSHIFCAAGKIIEGLQSHNCSLALKWCTENATKLSKLKSTLEFDLHLQEFLELVRKEDACGALKYARDHLASWAESNMEDLQTAISTLVFHKHLDISTRYEKLLSNERWQHLETCFIREVQRVYGLPVQSELITYLQAGLSVLKTPDSGNKESKDDPLSFKPLAELAERLPTSKHTHSKLVCYISKEPMDDSNPPMVLPNGYVYGLRSLEEAAFRNSGMIQCPRSKQMFSFQDAKKAYVC